MIAKDCPANYQARRIAALSEQPDLLRRVPGGLKYGTEVFGL
jgi:hypothetical protein